MRQFSPCRLGCKPQHNFTNDLKNNVGLAVQPTRALYHYQTMKYDTTFKELFPDVKVLFKLLTNSNVVNIENIEFPSVQQRRADLIATLENGGLLHLELQSDNDDKMLWRELEYCGLISQRYQQVPLQIVLYIGEQSPRFKTEINTPNLKYRYDLINIKDLDCTDLLQS
ncbi:MAG: hypothetical protein RIT27_360, partial [Pseudomonadota bacterium]